MIQRTARHATLDAASRRPSRGRCVATLLAATAILTAACDRRAAPGVVVDGVVSLSPAGTDLALAIGAGDRLVGVSTFDADPRVESLPRVGDYENVDWERIRALAPRHLITQQAPARLPAGFVATAKAASIALCPIHIDRLADIGVAMQAIGDALGRGDEARATWAEIKADLDAIRAAAASGPPVRTLLVTSDDGLGVAGVDTFLDDLLEIAGGVNAAGTSRPGYFKLDREQLLQVDPTVIVLLLPDASAATVERARQAFESLPDLAAVRTKRVRVVTRADVLQPNANVVRTARELAEAIRGDGALR